MYSRQLFLGILGIFFGVSVAGGVFAFLIMLGILPRMIDKSHTGNHVFLYENAIIVGGILGNICEVFPGIPLPVGWPLLALYGLCAGIFVGCISAALAEVLKTFPVMFRRIRLKVGLSYVMISFAVGKVAGGFYYFFQQMKAP